MRPEPRAIRSIRRQLLAWLLAATAVMGAVALFDTWREAERMADALADRVLTGSALVIAERATVNAEGQIEIAIPWGALEMLSSAAQDRVFYRIDSPPGTLVTGYSDLPVAEAVHGGPAGFTETLFRGEKVRIATLMREVSTGIDALPFVVTMAETTLAREALSREILWRSALRLAGMILGAATIVGLAVTVSLRPLTALGEAIAARSPDDLRPFHTPVPQEVDNLVQALNSLMLRLQRALEGLRNFTGNAAHQVRTPLTVIRTRLALAERATDPQDRAAHIARADAAAARAERVLAQLLALARVDAASSGSAVTLIDLVPLLRDLTAEHVPPAAEAGVDLGFDPPEDGAAVPARVEPLLLGEALHNLISNAILYAGRGAEVTVRLRHEGGTAVIEVMDDGPGMSETERARSGTRFERGSHETVPGTGLGLPVVSEVARLFGGRFELDAPPEGRRGLIARIILPDTEGS